jgi:hypothetical protein
MTKANIAIIIAVSDYHKQQSLPACRKDAEVIRAIVTASGKFLPEHILCIDTGTTSSRVKAELSKFLKGLDGTDVEELFFYYSGHGLFNDEFYYLFSDYEDGKRRQTSLTNNELDDMLKAKKPALAVKVVDACQSRQDYIKSRESFEKAIKDTGSRFDSCYFMFSSDQQQSSFASNDISDFTHQFALGIVTHNGDAIRYKDIIDYLSDTFDSSPRQHPFFVTQARHTELFSQLSDSIRESIKKALPQTTVTGSVRVTMEARVTATGITAPTNISSPGLSYMGERFAFTGALGTTTTTTTPPPVVPLPIRLRTAVEKEAGTYCTEVEASSRYQLILGTIIETPLTEPLGDLYEKKTAARKEYYVPSAEKLGVWAKENQIVYFVKPTYREEEYQSWEQAPLRPSTWSITGLMDPGYRQVTRTRQVIDGVESTVNDFPYKSILIEFVPKHLNLPWWNIWFAVVNSKTQIRIFYAFSRLQELNWRDRISPEKVEWRTADAPMKDEASVRAVVADGLRQLMGQIIDQLAERFGLAEKPNEPPKVKIA